MSFKMDGSVHVEGIQNEKNMINILDVHSDVLFNDPNVIVEHLGGTNNKADLLVRKSDNNLEKISVKRKNGLKNGSFDYINTSKLGLFNNLFKGTFNVYNSGYKLGIRNKRLDDKLKTSISNELNNINSDTLTDFLNEFVINPNIDMIMIITDVSDGVVYKYSFTETPIVNLMRDNYKSYIVESNKQSKKILFTNGEETIDLGLRFRLHLNNGYRAWQGVNGKKSSQLVVKIQQDRVDKLMDSIENKTVVSY